MNRNFKNLIGQRFGRLLVIERGPNAQWGDSRWWCQCDCGDRKLINGPDLRSGHTKSCGCFQMERMKVRALKHGHSRKGRRSREYDAWTEMRRRCYDPGHTSFRWYGGRIPPVTVHPLWRASFSEFLTYILAAIGPHPGKGWSLDRSNNDLGYVPGNLKWSTPTEQSENTRQNLIVTIDGITGPLSAICRKLGLPPKRVAALMRDYSLKRTAQEAADFVRQYPDWKPAQKGRDPLGRFL
jgi:hypothetical protein